MVPTLNTRSGLTARDSHLSPGAIAGTVIGCVIGGSLLLLVVGFLYFRYRRMSKEARDTESLPTAKAALAQGRTLFHIPGFPSRQAPPAQADDPHSLKDGMGRTVPTLSDGAETQQSQISGYGDDLIRHDESHYTHPDFGQPLPPGIDFSLPPQPPAFPPVSDPDPELPSDHASPSHEAANSSYYDTRISMDSDPEIAQMPMSRQMTELYEAQLKNSREHRRKRSGSLSSRIWNSIKRKRSTHSSTHGTGSPHYSGSNQYFPTSPVTSPVTIKQEPGLEMAEGIGMQKAAPTNRYFEEPSEISEETGVTGTSAAGSRVGQDQQQHKRQKRVDSQRIDSQYDGFPLRTSSSIRETTERDPELPSAVLRSHDSTDRLPHSAQPQSETRPQERLMSPAIPEPMELDETLDGVHRPIFQASRSPALPPESFVSPMSIMQPSNAAEKAAYTHYQMENSMSPPTFPTSPPEIITNQPSQENVEYATENHQDDFDADSFLDIPSDDEPRLSSDSYDYSTTPGQSSTDPSMGRTPDTRITVSPSPYPNTNEHVKTDPESSSSPEVTRPSPQSPGHMCEECGRYFDQVHKLNHHKRYHDRKHECPYEGCDKRFGTKTHLDRHINDKHVKSKAYHCTDPTCAYYRGRKAFPRKDNWRRHMVKKHGSTPNELEAMDESVG
ncbi:hypothetical protein F4820DRAFT_260245 [Hypoxylon rubiginosum]|uniref:Uncharacterized protein n=1 Tax=Hypoxylon rubiginosum TaxID=110542 RepID=A0ACB9Z3L5_9PEZI|nr:hypothetical protein F4820DRAFT_260245 [Hypoxylon rubiginosum]